MSEEVYVLGSFMSEDFFLCLNGFATGERGNTFAWYSLTGE